MCRKRVHVHAVAVAAAAVAVATAPHAEAGAIIPLDQSRSVNTFLIVPQCLGKTSDTDAAQGFDPFNSSVETTLDCDSGFGYGAASQQSQIGASSMTASGSGSSMADGPVQNVIHAFGISYFEVTFELPSLSRFALDGTMTAGSLPDANFGAIVLARLWEGRIGGVLLFQQSIEPPPGGGTNKQALEAAGVLEPGVYTLDVQAGSFIDNDVPPSRSGQASFAFTFDVTILADITGPFGVPDGCVDGTDLAAMLGAWCSAVNDPFPPSPPCGNCSPANLDLADITGPGFGPPDGCVDGNDLAMLLGEWCSVAGGNPCGTCFPPP